MAKDAIVSEDLASKFATEKDTPYTRWVRGEGLEIISAHYVPSLHEVELRPWARRGGRGVQIALSTRAAEIYERLIEKALERNLALLRMPERGRKDAIVQPAGPADRHRAEHGSSASERLIPSGCSALGGRPTKDRAGGPAKHARQRSNVKVSRASSRCSTPAAGNPYLEDGNGD